MVKGELGLENLIGSLVPRPIPVYHAACWAWGRGNLIGRLRREKAMREVQEGEPSSAQTC